MRQKRLLDLVEVEGQSSHFFFRDSKPLLELFFKDVSCFVIEVGQADVVELLRLLLGSKVSDRCEEGFSAERLWEAEDPGRNSRDSNTGAFEFLGRLKSVEHGIVKQVHVVLLRLAVVPDGANCMDHVFALEAAAACDSAVASLNDTVLLDVLVAFILDDATALAHDSSSNSATMSQVLICSICDCVHLLIGDVVLDDLNFEFVANETNVFVLALTLERN